MVDMTCGFPAISKLLLSIGISSREPAGFFPRDGTHIPLPSLIPSLHVPLTPLLPFGALSLDPARGSGDPCELPQVGPAAKRSDEFKL